MKLRRGAEFRRRPSVPCRWKPRAGPRSRRRESRPDIAFVGTPLRDTEASMSMYRLEHLFNPQSISIIGGSPRETSLGRIVLRNLRQAGFAGELHVVNPHHAEIDGMRTVRSLGQIAAPPDVIVVTAPAPAVPGIIAEGGARGVATAVVISAGLGHGDGSLAAEASAAARRYGLRVIGPNGLGV